MTRQPGTMACAMATSVLFVQFAAIVLGWAIAWSWTLVDPSTASPVSPFGVTPPVSSPLKDLWLVLHSEFLASTSAAHGIPGAWVIMFLGGWWRPERSAIERLGLMFGLAWIAVVIAEFVARVWLALP
jgi:hypothetical protein